MKTKLILMVMFLILVSISFARTDYNQTGTENQYYVSGAGQLNEGTTAIITSKTFSDLKNIPLVSDLDNDGNNEIIIIDNNDVVLRDSDLNAINAVTLETGTYSNPIIKDIDNDGYSEIILANENSGNGNISILQYNGSTFIRETLLGVEVPTIADGTIEIMINCNDGQGLTESISCLYAIAISPKTSGTRNYSIASFNASDVSQPTTLVSTTDSNDDFCFPLIPSIAYEEFDVGTGGDSRKEFIFTATHFKRLANEILHIYYVDVAEDLTRTIDLTTTFSSGFFPFFTYNPLTTALSCEDNIGRYYTSPLVFDFDQNTGNGKETAVGINKDTDDFKIITFKADGSALDDHPEFFEADGEILSGIMLADIYGDSGQIDFCVLGHDDDAEELDLLCGSEDTGGTQTTEFKFSTANRFNLSILFNKQNIISHAGQHDGTLINIDNKGQKNTNEFITTYGVFRISDNTFNGSFFVKSMDLIFTNPVGDSICIPVDVQKTGSEDLICIKEGTLYLVDDNLQNEPAFISENILFEPCINEGAVKRNETMQISVTVEDGNSDIIGKDLVGSNVTLYAGTSNEMITSFQNITSGETRFHVFESLNQTGAVNVEIKAYDMFDISEIEIITTTFTVANEGVEFGDCSSEIIVVIEEVDGVRVLNETTTLTDNELVSTVEEISNLAGVPIIIFLLLVMAVVDLIILIALWQIPYVAIGVVLIADFFIILISALMGLMGTALLISLFAIIIIAGGIFITWAYNKVTGGG